MREQTLKRQVLWLAAAIVLLVSLSWSADYWLQPHWDSALGAWVTGSSGAYWDASTQRWTSETSDEYWNDERGVWMYSNGVYWSESQNAWLDPEGDHFDTVLGAWVDLTGSYYWDEMQRQWTPLSAVAGTSQ